MRLRKILFFHKDIASVKIIFGVLFCVRIWLQQLDSFVKIFDRTLLVILMVKSQSFVVIICANVFLAAALFFLFKLDGFRVRGYSVTPFFKLEITESEVVLVSRLFWLHFVCSFQLLDALLKFTDTTVGNAEVEPVAPQFYIFSFTWIVSDMLLNC